MKTIKNISFIIIFMILYNLNINCKKQLPQKNHDTKKQKITFVKENGIEYAIILPNKFNKKKKYHLAIGLHGLDGDWKTFTKTFAKYSRQQKIIFVSLVANRKHKKFKRQWAYRGSETYLKKALAMFSKRFNLYKEKLLFGYSQGAHQGLYFYLKFPKLFSHFVAFSGGHTKLSKQQFKNSFHKKIFFITGTGDSIDRYLTRVIKLRVRKLQKNKAFVSHKILKGVSHKYSYKNQTWLVFNWFMKELTDIPEQEKIFIYKE